MIAGLFFQPVQAQENSNLEALIIVPFLLAPPFFAENAELNYEMVLLPNEQQNENGEFNKHASPSISILYGIKIWQRLKLHIGAGIITNNNAEVDYPGYIVPEIHSGLGYSWQLGQSNWYAGSQFLYTYILSESDVLPNSFFRLYGETFYHLNRVDFVARVGSDQFGNVLGSVGIRIGKKYWKFLKHNRPIHQNIFKRN